MNKKLLTYPFYSSLIFLYISDMGAMISIIWASLEITGSTIFLGSILCISSLLPFFIKKIYTRKSLSISNLYVLRALFYVVILLITLLGVATEYFGFIITILLFGIVNILTLSVYETYNSYMVNNSYISSELAARIMQTVLQSGAFLGAIIAGSLISNIGYENVIKLISIYEIILNILFYFLNRSIDSSQMISTSHHFNSTVNTVSTNKEIKLIYILCLPLGMIGVHISSFNILSTVIFQNINNWDSTLFGYASGLAGVGAFLASFISFKRVHFIIYTFILILFDIIYSHTNSPSVAIFSCFFIGFSINTIRINIRKNMLDIASSPFLSQKMGELSASFYVFFQSIGSVIIGIIISDNLAGESFSRILLPIIGIMIFLSSYISILISKEK